MISFFLNYTLPAILIFSDRILLLFALLTGRSHCYSNYYFPAYMDIHSVYSKIKIVVFISEAKVLQYLVGSKVGGGC